MLISSQKGSGAIGWPHQGITQTPRTEQKPTKDGYRGYFIVIPISLPLLFHCPCRCRIIVNVKQNKHYLREIGWERG